MSVAPPTQATCPRCANAVPPDARACRHCGLALSCRFCGARYRDPVHDVFCAECGDRIVQPPRPEAPEADEAAAPARGAQAGSDFYRMARELFERLPLSPPSAGETSASPLATGVKRVLRRTAPSGIGALYLRLGTALARAERFEEATEAFVRALAEGDVDQVEVLRDLAGAARGAGANDLATRAWLELALVDPAGAEPAIRRAHDLLDDEVAESQGGWTLHEWRAELARRDLGPDARCDAALLGAHVALYQDDDDAALRLLADAHDAAPARAQAAAERVLGDRSLPRRLRGGGREAAWTLARAYAALGRPAEALAHAERVLEASTDPDGTEDIAVLQLKADQLERDARASEAAACLLEIGRRFDLQVRHDLAVAQLERATELDPDNALAFWYLADSRRLVGGAELDEGQLLRAHEEWERGLALERPGPERAWVHLVGAMLNEMLAALPGVQDAAGRRWSAVLQAEQATALDPYAADAWAIVARGHGLLEHSAVALQAAERAVELDPGNQRAAFDQVFAHAILGLDDVPMLAAAYLERFDALDAEVLTIQAYAAGLDRRPDEALPALDAALERNADLGWARVERALALAALGRDDAAREDATRVLEAMAPDGEAHAADADDRALAALLLDRSDEAALLYADLVDGASLDELIAGFGLACARLLQGERDEAIRLGTGVTERFAHRRHVLEARRMVDLVERLRPEEREAVGALRRAVDASHEATPSISPQQAGEELRAAAATARDGSVPWIVARAGLARTLALGGALEQSADIYEELMAHEDPVRGFAAARGALIRTVRERWSLAVADRDVAGVRAMAERLVELDAASPSDAAMAVAQVHESEGDVAAALAELEGAADMARAAGEVAELRRARMQTGDVLLRAGRATDAEAVYGQTLASARAEHAPEDEVTDLEVRFGVAAAAREDVLTARERLRTAMTELQPITGRTVAADNVMRRSLSLDVHPPALPTVLRALIEHPELTPGQRRRLAGARCATLREAGPPALPTVNPLMLETGEALFPEGSESFGARHLIDEAIPLMRERILDETGVRIPGVRIQTNPLLGPTDYALLLDEIPYCRGTVPGDARLLLGEGELRHPWSGERGAWRDAADDPEGRGLGPYDAMLWRFEGYIRVRLAEFVGLSELNYELESWEADGGRERAALLRRVLPRRRDRIALMEAVRRLVREQVPVDLDAILGAIGRPADELALDSTIDQARRALRAALPGNRDGRRRLELEEGLEGALAEGADVRAQLAERIAGAAPGSFVLVVEDRAARRQVQRLAESLLGSAAVMAREELLGPAGASVPEAAIAVSP
jgi:tetratricopeptide (TPR) repeat protein